MFGDSGLTGPEAPAAETKEHRMNSLTQAMIVNAIVLITVLVTDLGPARKITRFRLARPVIAAAVIIPLFVQHPDFSGHSLAVEVAGVAAGLLAGLGALALMRVHRSPVTGQPVTAASLPYAAFWTLIIGARAFFSYGSAHLFTTPLVTWAIQNQVSGAAFVDGLVFMAIAMIVVRTAGLSLRAARLPALTAQPAAKVPAAA
jgi:hypothetical protein